MENSGVNLFVMLTQAFNSEITALPLYFLHGAAFIGLIVTVLSLSKGDKYFNDKNIGLGLCIGVTCIVMTLLTTTAVDGYPRNVPVTNYLFIAGILGGWRNALVVFIFVFSRLYIFGGDEELIYAFFDYLFVGMGAAAVHKYLKVNFIDNINLKLFVYLILIRFVLVEVFPVILYAVGLMSPEETAVLATRRFVVSFTVSIFIVGITLLVLKQKLELEKIFFTDNVSGLPNRRALQVQLNDMLVNSGPGTVLSPHVILLVELENFHNLVQSYGFDWVDKYLMQLSLDINEQCKHYFKNHDTKIFVFSGNSYAILVKDANKEFIQAEKSAQGLLNSLELIGKQDHARDNSVEPSFSISVIDVQLNSNFDSVRFLRTVAMLEKGDFGKIQFFESDVEQQILLEEKVYSYVKDWITHGTVPVSIQPKVNLATGRCVGGEALLRAYTQGADNYIIPYQVIRIADKYNLRQELEWSILCQVIKYLKQFPPELNDLKVSVNVTPDLFMIHGIAKEIIEHMKQSGVAPERFIIEVIETSKFTPTIDVKENISALLDYGIKLSLDDFGTGYSSISLLSQYNFKELKIDYTMTSNIKNPRMLSAIQLCIETAQRYDANMVVEGIETEEQRQLLLSMGVGYGQGYLFGKAMTIEDYIKYALNQQKEYSNI